VAAIGFVLALGGCGKGEEGGPSEGSAQSAAVNAPAAASSPSATASVAAAAAGAPAAFAQCASCHSAEPGKHGIGPSLAKTIVELATTGTSSLLTKLRAQTPPGVVELHPVLSLSRIKAVHDALGVATLAELRAACEAGRLRTVRGAASA